MQLVRMRQSSLSSSEGQVSSTEHSAGQGASTATSGVSASVAASTGLHYTETGEQADPLSGTFWSKQDSRTSEVEFSEDQQNFDSLLTSSLRNADSCQRESLLMKEREDTTSSSSVNSATHDYSTLGNDGHLPLQNKDVRTRRSTLKLRTASNAAKQTQVPGCCKKFCEFITSCCRAKKEVSRVRKGEIGIANETFPENTSKTSRYTALNFVPKSLLEQFRRVANVYFLVISILMIIGTYAPDVFDSPLSPFSTLAPLIIVLTITMVKEGLEDWKRHQSDNEVNNRRAFIFHQDSKQCSETVWESLCVGHIVKVYGNEEAPADLIVLQSSKEGGGCYIETSNIDGETDLKLKSSVPQVRSRFQDTTKLKGTFECDHPNDMIHVFNGAVTCYSNDDPRPETYGVNAKNIVLRGATVRNTDWIIGLVVYTGRDTKVMKKGGSVRSKLSKIEQTMNKCLMIIFSAQFVLCTVTTVAVVIWENIHKDNLWYLKFEASDYKIPKWLGQWFSFLILYNNFIPISLYVTVEMVNYAQAFLIDKDVEMYDEDTDTPAKARTSNINQDLGQIKYIFSDKTGTLTQNVMEFRMFSTGKKAYGERPSEAEQNDSVGAGYENETRRNTHFDVSCDEEVVRLLSGQGNNPTEADSVKKLFEALALCHTVVAHAKDDGSLDYQAESPDEGALVRAASNYGFAFQHRTHTHVVVDVYGLPRTYELKGVHEFSSARKRMSIVAVDASGTATLYCKGADDVMLQRIKTSKSCNRSKVLEHLTMFATEGLRTLVVAKRELTQSELVQWQTRYDQASALSVDRDKALFELADEYESGMELLGATGIEDKLQDGVPDTIQQLRRAGIKLWVLTGDKIETAINIGRSCNLIDSNIDYGSVVRVSGDNAADVFSILDNLEEHYLSDKKEKSRRIDPRSRGKVVVAKRDIIEIEESLDEPEQSLEAKRSRSNLAPISNVITMDSPLHRDRSLRKVLTQGMSNGFALVITGEALAHVLGHTNREKQLVRLSEAAKSVIACRVSPAQKAKVVAMVSRRVFPRPMTLAIGDGANDVNMLQRAEVGVGISGREGLQAVNSSDFSIAQFRFLLRLMLLHGRWNYSRMSKVVLYSFYKNIVLTLTLFTYNAFTGFSGTSFYESMIYSGYNFFLGWPIVMIGIFDRDLTEKTVMDRPEVYISGLRNMDVNPKVMTGWILHSVVYALIIFFIPYFVYAGSDDILSGSGQASGMAVTGHTTYSAMIFAMQLRVAMITNTWTILNHFFWWLSTLGYLGAILVYSLMLSFAPDFFHVAETMVAQPSFWLTCILVVLACFCFEMIVQLFYQWFSTYVLDKYQAAEAGECKFPSFVYDDGEVKSDISTRDTSTLADSREPTDKVAVYNTSAAQKRRTPSRNLSRSFSS